MIDPLSIVLLIVILGLTLFLQRWLHRHIQGFTYSLTQDPGCAMRVLFVLLLPGILLHEGSHWVVANILGVRTGRVSIGLARARGKMMSLGSVDVERTDALRESLIGLAPFAVGLTAIFLIAGYGFGLWPGSAYTVRQMFDRVLLDLGRWPAWLYLYLIFAVSTAMIPSESDREPWGLLVLMAGAIAAAAFFLGWIPRVSLDLIHWGRLTLDALNLALGVSAVVNAVVAFVLWIAELTVSSFTQRRIRY